MANILAIANQKGGVGKTTTATNLAHAFGLAGRRVLLIDVDPQGNATSGMGAEMVDTSPAFTPAHDADIIQTSWQGVSCVPAGRDLERWSTQRSLASTCLRENLDRLEARRFDVILIDCPPSLGLLTQNALAAASSVLVPIQCEYYPLEGLVQLLAAVRQAALRNPMLRIGGVLLTMYAPNSDLSSEVEAEVREKLDEPVFQTVIPRDEPIAEAPSHCLSVIQYAPRSRGARAYVALADEIKTRGLIG